MLLFIVPAAWPGLEVNEHVCMSQYRLSFSVLLMWHALVSTESNILQMILFLIFEIHIENSKQHTDSYTLGGLYAIISCVDNVTVTE